jgi:hypothetical protein
LYAVARCLLNHNYILYGYVIGWSLESWKPIWKEASIQSAKFQGVSQLSSFVHQYEFAWYVYYGVYHGLTI